MNYQCQDSGAREEQGTGAVRDTRRGKGRYDLISPFALRRVAQVLERGAMKYGKKLTFKEAIEVCVCEHPIAIQSVNTMPADSVDRVTKKTSETATANMPNDNAKIADVGLETTRHVKPQAIGNIRSEFDNVSLKSATNEHWPKEDSQSRTQRRFLNTKVEYVPSAEEKATGIGSIATMTTTPDLPEGSYAEAATKPSDSLEMIQSFLSGHDPTCPLHRSKLLSDGVTIQIPGDRNWEQGILASRCLDSAIRHLYQYLEGQRDEDHLGHAVFNIFAIMHFEETRPEMIDLPGYEDAQSPAHKIQVSDLRDYIAEEGYAR